MNISTKNHAVVLAGLLALAATQARAASAADDAAQASVRQAFGKTIVSTYPDGRQGELWLKADGSYTAKGRRGDPSGGHWKVKGDKLCLKQSKPMAVWFSYCTPIPQGGMGREWSAKAVTGEAIRVRLVSGRG